MTQARADAAAAEAGGPPPAPLGARRVLGMTPRRAAAFAAALAAVAVLALSGSSWASRPLWHALLRSLGLLGVSAGVLGRVWASVFIAGRKGREVVRSGPYAAMRHPLYFFSSLAAGGIGLSHGSLALGAAFFASSWLGMRALARAEERRLGASLDYAAYREAVDGLRRRRVETLASRSVEVDPAAIWRTIRDGFWFFLGPAGLVVVQAVHDAGWLPVLIRLP